MTARASLALRQALCEVRSRTLHRLCCPRRWPATCWTLRPARQQRCWRQSSAWRRRAAWQWLALTPPTRLPGNWWRRRWRRGSSLHPSGRRALRGAAHKRRGRWPAAGSLCCILRLQGCPPEASRPSRGVIRFPVRLRRRSHVGLPCAVSCGGEGARERRRPSPPPAAAAWGLLASCRAFGASSQPRPAQGAAVAPGNRLSPHRAC